MIEGLKGEEIVNLAGGRFKLCSLIQKRVVQFMEGARPLVDRDGRSDLELAIDELLQGKIGLSDEAGNLLAPTQAQLDEIEARQAAQLPEGEG